MPLKLPRDWIIKARKVQLFFFSFFFFFLTS